MKTVSRAIAPWIAVVAVLAAMGFAGWIEGGMQ